MDRLTRREQELRVADAYALLAPAYEVHLDAALFPVVKGAVRKPIKEEIGVQLAVDTRQEVEVECCRDALAVVVRRLDHTGIFLKIGAEQKSPARPTQPRGASQQGDGLIRREV